MEADGDRALRSHLEEQLGRRISDDDWQALKRAQLTTSQASSEPERAGWAAALGGLAGIAVGLTLFGAVLVALYFGLLWAYSPDTLAEEDHALTLGSFLGAAAIVGVLVLSWSEGAPRLTAALVGIALIGGVVALAVGAILRVT